MYNRPSQTAEMSRGSADFDEFDLPFEEQSNDLFDIRKIVATLWRGKWLLIILLLASLGAGYFIVSNQIKTYSATASILLEPEQRQIVNLAEFLAEPETQNNLGNQLEILSSSKLLDRVVERLGVEIFAEQGAQADTGAFDEWLISSTRTAFASAEDHLKRLIGAADAPGSNAEDSAPADEISEVQENATPEDTEMKAKLKARQKIDRNLGLTNISGSRVIEISYTAPDPAITALVANTIGEEYITFQAQLRNQNVQNISDMMNSRISDLKQQLDRSETVLADARLDLSRRRAQSSDMTSIQLSALNRELADIRLQLASSSARYERAANALLQDEDLWSINEFRQSELIIGFRLRAIEIQEKMAEDRAISGGANTPSKTVRSALLEQLNENIKQEASYIVSALDFEVESLKQRESQLNQMVQDLEVTAIEQTTDEVYIARLKREVDADQTLYESFVDRLKEINEQANFQSDNANFLSRAETPTSPDRENGDRFMAVMAASALLLGTFILLFREQINNTFSDPNDLTKATGLPILAAVPLNGRSKSAKRLVARFLSQPRSVLSESIRGLRTSILYSDPVNQPKVVMFTSSQPGEGKSALSMLIGLASQQTRRRAILVNCDLRNHRNARFYNKMPRLLTSEETPDTPARPGLVAYYNKSCTLNEALSHEPKSGLNFLALGPRESLSESPADVFSSRRFAEILETLRESYDLVILDTPPALAVTDSRLLARLSDSIVYVVRWNKTKRNAVKEGLKEISMMKINVAGCVFSMVSQRKARKYSDNEYIYKQAYSGYYN